MAPLARHSFALHAELAQELGAETIGYRRCRAVQPTCAGGETAKSGGVWYDGCEGTAAEIAPMETVSPMH